MPSNERLPQKPSTRGTARKGGGNPISINTTQDQSIRDTRYSDEDFLLIEDDPDASNPPRQPSSAIRINPPTTTRRSSRDVSTETRRPAPYVPARRTQKPDPGQFPVASTARPTRNTTVAYPEAPARYGRTNVHWLLYVGLSMLAILALWALGAAALTWGTNKYNDFVYGYPRTYQIDQTVGHNDSARNPSHFIAVNLHGQVIIFELPGGDPSKAINYPGPDLIGPQDDLLPVTLSFKDINSDGKVDMILHVSDKNFVFYNNGTTFAHNNTNQSPTPTPTP